MINIGIIGMGRMGEIHADWIMGNKDLNLIAVSKKNNSRIEELKNKYEVEVYLNNDDLLINKKIDYVVIATTNEVHEELTIQAMKKGKNVIVEKPMSMDYKSTLRMIEASNNYKKNLFVYQSQRWDRDYLLVKDIIDSNKLGKIMLIEANTLEFGEEWGGWGIHGMDDPWRFKAKYGGGILMDWGPHLVDHILQIMKKDPLGVFGILQSGTWSNEVEDFFSAILKFNDNVICKIRAFSNCMIPPPRWFIVGTKGTLKVKGTLTNIWDEAEISFKNDDGQKELQKIKMIDHPGAGFSSGFYDNFVKYINGEISEFVTMHDGSKVVKILEMIRKSSEKSEFISF